MTSSITRDFGWLYLWVVLALVLKAVALWRGVRDDWDEERGMIGQQTGASAPPDRR